MRKIIRKNTELILRENINHILQLLMKYYHMYRRFLKKYNG